MNALTSALRQSPKTADFAAAALLIVAIWVCLNLAIFGVIDAVVVRNLPFPTPDQLGTMFSNYPKTATEPDGSPIAPDVLRKATPQIATPQSKI